MLNRWKRLLALLASVAVLFSLCTAASAAPGEQAEPRELTEADILLPFSAEKGMGKEDLIRLLVQTCGG